MINNTDINGWKPPLCQMKRVDPNFPETRPHLDQDCYQLLKWRYDGLRDGNLENGFLYCAMFHEDAQIIGEELVHPWIAEALVKDKDEDYLLDEGHSFIKLLVNCCSLQVRGGVFQL